MYYRNRGKWKGRGMHIEDETKLSNKTKLIQTNYQLNNHAKTLKNNYVQFL